MRVNTNRSERKNENDESEDWPDSGTAKGIDMGDGHFQFDLEFCTSSDQEVRSERIQYYKAHPFGSKKFGGSVHAYSSVGVRAVTLAMNATSKAKGHLDTALFARWSSRGPKKDPRCVHVQFPPPLLSLNRRQKHVEQGQVGVKTLGKKTKVTFPSRANCAKERVDDSKSTD